MEDCKWTLRLLHHRQEQVPIEFRFKVKVCSKFGSQTSSCFLVEKFWWLKWLLEVNCLKWLLLEINSIRRYALDWSTEITAIKLFNLPLACNGLSYYDVRKQCLPNTAFAINMPNGLIIRDLSGLRQSWRISKHLKASQSISKHLKASRRTSTQYYYRSNLAAI